MEEALAGTVVVEKLLLVLVQQMEVPQEPRVLELMGLVAGVE